MTYLNAKTRPVPSLRGIWNSQRQERLPYGTMKQADNVVVDNTGTIERRDGYTKVVEFTDATDGFGCDHLEYCVVVDNGELKTVFPDYGVYTIASGLTEKQYQWAQIEDRIVFAGRSEAGLILGGRNLLPLRIPVPTDFGAVPVVGTLPAGTYQITALFRHISSGLEGGSAPSAAFTLAGPGGMLVSVDVPTGYEADVFATSVDDTVERYIGTTRDTLVFSTFEQMEEPLEEAQTQAVPLPYNITALCFHEGSLYAATYDPKSNLGAILCSEPYFYHLFKPVDPDLGNIGVSSRVFGMASTDAGLLVATDRAIFVHHDGVLTKLADFGAIPGRPVARDLNKKVSIWTDRGLCTFPDFKNRYQLQDGDAWKLTVPPGTWASNNFVDHQGMKLGIVLSDNQGAPYNVYGAPYGQHV